jgi:hypothetical protein
MPTTTAIKRLRSLNFPNDPHFTKLLQNLRHVKDAFKYAALEITKKDVTNAVSKNPAKCPLANACNRMYHADGTVVFRSVIYIIKGTTATRYMLSRAMRQQLAFFDRGMQFDTGVYSMRAPPPVAQLGHKPNPNPRTYDLRPAPKRLRLGKRTGAPYVGDSPKRDSGGLQRRTVTIKEGGAVLADGKPTKPTSEDRIVREQWGLRESLNHPAA